jgi:hypothetical protein
MSIEPTMYIAGRAIAHRRLRRILFFISVFSIPNARPEWRGAKRVEVQTEAAIPRPLQAVCYADG